MQRGGVPRAEGGWFIYRRVFVYVSLKGFIAISIIKIDSYRDSSFGEVSGILI